MDLGNMGIILIYYEIIENTRNLYWNVVYDYYEGGRDPS